VSDAAAQSLLYAVRPAVIAKRTGQLGLVLAGLAAAPLLVSLAAGEAEAALRYAIVLVALAVLGTVLARRAAPGSIQTNEALVVCALAFTLAPLAMTYPVMASGIDFADALFECVSGITTTGLSALGSVEGRPASLLFERAWMQWIGGLGIVVLSVALLAGDDMAARRLVESPISQESLATSTRLYARRSIVTYALLSIASMALLWLAGWSGFDAVVLALAAISTGGFAPHDASLAAAPLWPARAAVLGIALLGAVSLPLYHAAWRRRWTELAQDPELRLLLVMCALGSVALMLLMAHARGAWSLELAANAVAMAVSAQTTSGFATMPLTQLDAASMLALIIAMTVGGSVGSTAGGIKLLRLLLLMRMVQHVLRRTAMPGRAVTVLRVQGRPVSDEAMSRALFVALLFAMTVLLSWLPFLALGHPPMAALFEVVSATGTVGMSAGVTGPGLHPLLKGVLCIDMLMGRVEFVAMLVMFYPRTWFGRRRST
jgi:trk system potassium uptake protein TrkH